MPPAPPPPARRIIVRLAGAALLLAISGVVGLGISELAVRLVRPQQLIEDRPDLYEAADTVGYLHRPNVVVSMNTGERTVTVRTDSAGFRVGRAGRQEADTRVLLLGDSFMEALQVEHEQSFAHLLERGLADRLGRPVVVRNAGLSGYDPSQYLARAIALLPREKYDLLVVAFFVGNDAMLRPLPYRPPRQPAEEHHFHLPRGLSMRALIDAFFAPANDLLEGHSHLFVLLKNELSVLRMKLGLTAEYFAREYLKAEAGSPRWVVTAAIAREIRDTAAAHGVPTVFVLVPEAFQVYRKDFDSYVRGFGIDSTAVDLDQPSRRLEEEFRAAGLMVQNTLADYRAHAGDGERRFGRVDHHFSPAGNALLAELVLPTAVEAIRTAAHPPHR